MNYSAKLNLLKVQSAFVTNLKGKTTTKQCLVIPIEDAHLYTGDKGVYLDLAAVEVQNSQYGDTHLLKQNLPKGVYDTMTEEQRRALPILGNMRMIQQQPKSLPAADIVTNNEDLPF